MSNESSFNTNTFVSFEDCRITETMDGCVSEAIEGASVVGSWTIITAATSLNFTLASIYFTLNSSYLKLFAVVAIAEADQR